MAALDKGLCILDAGIVSRYLHPVADSLVRHIAEHGHVDAEGLKNAEFHFALPPGFI